MKQLASAADIAARYICGAVCRSVVVPSVTGFHHMYLDPLIRRVFGSGATSNLLDSEVTDSPLGPYSLPVAQNVRWTAGSEVDLQAFDEDDWSDWINDVAFDQAAPLGLFLTNVDPVESLSSRFEARPGVLAVRPGGRSYVLVTFWRVRSDSEAVSRLAAARCLLAH